MKMEHNVARASSHRPWPHAIFHLSRRQTFLLAGATVLGIGLTLNWTWLTAIGVAPILISLVPCAAMCALGLCMRGGQTKTCATHNETDAAPSDKERE